MTPCCVRTPQAKTDLIDIAAYIGRDSPAIADRFLDAAEETISRLAERPPIDRICQFREGPLRGLRRWAIRGYVNYIVFYHVRDYGIEIVRVLHGARDIDAVLQDD